MSCDVGEVMERLENEQSSLYEKRKKKLMALMKTKNWKDEVSVV